MSLLDLFNPPIPPKPVNISFIRNDMKTDSPRPTAKPKPKRTHCFANHKFTPENTKVRKDGSRICMICAKKREGK